MYGVYLSNIIYQVSISKTYLKIESGNKNTNIIEAGIKDKINKLKLPLTFIRLLLPLSKNINQITLR
tara:strand:+ start:2255 stop:2455 length:201 start_codon:yes stop_codon:yes gene_type:complete